MSSQAINGFILTSHWDENPSPQVTLFGVSDQIGAFQLNFINEKFVVFVAQASDLSNCSVKYELKTLKMKSFDKNGVDAVYLKRSKDFFAFKQFCSENGVRTFENDIWPNDRFLMERFINGTLSFQGAGQLNGNVTVFNNPIVKATNTDQKFSVLSVDIETGTKGQLYSIGVHYSGKHSFKYVYMLGETSQEHDGLSILTSETDVYKHFLKPFLNLIQILSSAGMLLVLI